MMETILPAIVAMIMLIRKKRVGEGAIPANPEVFASTGGMLSEQSRHGSAKPLTCRGRMKADEVHDLPFKKQYGAKIA